MYLNHYGITTFKQLKKDCKEVQYLMNNERAIDMLGYQSAISFKNEIQNIPMDQRVTKTMFDYTKWT